MKVGDKYAVNAAALLVDEDVEYILGRIENDKFIRESGGEFQFGRKITSFNGKPGQYIEEPDGRVIRWHWMYEIPNPNKTAVDIVRSGWQNGYTIPHVVSLNDAEDRLLFAPAPELEDLRERDIIHESGLKLTSGKTVFPEQGGNRAHIEVRVQFVPATGAKAGIVLKESEDNQITFSYDTRNGKLSMDFSKTNGSWDGNPLETTLNLKEGEPVELQLFYDASFVEAYAKSACGIGVERTFGRWFPDSPKDVQIGFFSEGGDIVMEEVKAWEMGTIWKEAKQ
jgi:sucrose-6-phosphate hydrolase SacC (GH32 family)